MLSPAGTKEIIQDPERKDLIKETFSLYASGDYSVEELTKVMRNKGLTIKAKKGREPRSVDKSDLLWILNNRFYTGKFEWVNPTTGEREVYASTNYEPLIDEDLFNSVKQILNKKSIKYSTRHSSTKFYKFRGLINCGFCGCVMTPMDLSTNYKNKKPGEEIYYRCTYQKKSIDPEYYKKKFGENHSGVSERKKKITKGKYSDEKEKIYNCPQMYWKEEEIEGEIKRYLKSLKYDADVFRQIKEKLNQEFQARISISEAQRKSLEIDLNKKEKLRTGLVRKIAMEDDLKEVIPDLKAELVKVKKEMEDIEREIEFIKEMEDADIEEVTSVLELANDLYVQYDKLSDMDRRRLIMTAFKRISVRRGKVDDLKFNSMDVYWTEPFWELFEKFVWSDDDENEPNPSTTPNSGSFNKLKDSPRGLSGHGFSPIGREERRTSGS